MDELSWRAKLAKSNINILSVDIDHNVLYYEFAYRPHAGVAAKWVKTTSEPVMDTFAAINEGTLTVDWKATTERLRTEVLGLRKELED